MALLVYQVSIYELTIAQKSERRLSHWLFRKHKGYHVPNKNAGTPVEIALYRCRLRCRPGISARSSLNPRIYWLKLAQIQRSRVGQVQLFLQLSAAWIVQRAYNVQARTAAKTSCEMSLTAVRRPFATLCRFFRRCIRELFHFA